jgi:hypothetical protein
MTCTDLVAESAKVHSGRKDLLKEQPEVNVSYALQPDNAGVC